MFKIGDKVLFCVDLEDYDYYCGTIIDKTENEYVVLFFNDNKSLRTIKTNKVYEFDKNIEYIKSLVNAGYFQIIKDLDDKLKNITEKEKDEEKIRKYNEIKTLIIKNCERIIGVDDYEFERRLKEICKLKNEIYSIKIECVDEINKYNQNIKYNITKKNQKRDAILKRLEKGVTWV